MGSNIFYRAIVIVLLFFSSAYAQTETDKTVMPNNTKFNQRMRVETRTKDRTPDYSHPGAIWFNITDRKFRGDLGTSVFDFGSGTGGGTTLPTNCIDNQVVKWSFAGQVWVCANDETATPGSGITNFNGQIGSVQNFGNDTNVTITSNNNTHTLGWSGVLGIARGGLNTSTVPSDGQIPVYSVFNGRYVPTTPAIYGDASTTTSVSIDGESALFSGTGGKQLRRSTLTAAVGKWSAGIASAAASGDIISLFDNGSCSGYLNSDGHCYTTTAGDFFGPSSSVDSQVVIFNGTGGKTGKAFTLSAGVLKSTTGVLSASVASDIVGLFGGGKCSGYLFSDGTCATPSGVPGGSDNDIQIKVGNTFTGGRGSLDSSQNLTLTGVVTASAFQSSDTAHSGATWLKGKTSGGTAIVAPDSGDSITLVTPSTATTVNQVLMDNGSTTCPTLISGLPSTCHQVIGVSSSGTGNFARVDSPTFTTQITTPKIVYTTGVIEIYGTNSPEGVVTANVGSVFHRTDGGTATTLYVKESGTGNTGWSAAGAGGGSSAFNAITTGNNTTATMQCTGSCAISGNVDAATVGTKSVGSIWLGKTAAPTSSNNNADTTNCPVTGCLNGDEWSDSTNHRDYFKESESGGVAVWKERLVYGGPLGTPASATLTNATGLPTAGLVDNAVTSAKLSVANTIRQCIIENDTQSATALTDAQITGRCDVPEAAHVYEVAVFADGGTPTLTLERWRPNGGTTADILSATLATGSSGAYACARSATSATCDSGITSSGSVTLAGAATVAVAKKDVIRVKAATAGGTATWHHVVVSMTLD